VTHEERTMALSTLHDLFVHTLGDIYYAENQILKALPKMAQQANSSELKEAFQNHLEETRGQVQRLEQVFQMLKQPAKGEKCDAIEGIIKEAEGLMSEIDDESVRDAGMLAAAQAVEHYEISRYGTLIAWADQLELDDAIDLLEQNLEEEKNADQLLTEIAEGDVNEEAE
jgi:ferritin-like metal-binding protein YciE